MNKQIITALTFLLLTHSFLIGVLIGIDNRSTKEITAQFGFLVTTPSGNEEAISDTINVKPGKFQKWEEKSKIEEIKGSNSYLTFFSINGEMTRFGRAFIGKYWYLDVIEKKQKICANLKKFLDCYFNNGIMQKIDTQEFVPSRMTQLFVSCPVSCTNKK